MEDGKWKLWGFGALGMGLRGKRDKGLRCGVALLMRQGMMEMEETMEREREMHEMECHLARHGWSCTDM